MNSFVVGHKKIIRSAFIVAILALFAAPILTDVYYVNHMPSMPDPTNGRVHWMSLMHGHEIYVTADEKQLNRMIAFGSLTGFAAVAGIGFWLQQRYFSEEEAREAQLRKGLKLKELFERDRKP